MVRLSGVSALIAVVAMLGAPSTFARTDPPPAHGNGGPRSALLWGTELFLGPSSFEEWLRDHHQTYPLWAASHPSGRAILAAAAEFTPFRPGRAALARAAPVRSPVSPTSPVKRNSIVLILLALGAAFTSVAIVPFSRIAPDWPRAAVLERQRFRLSAISLGIIVGLIVAKLAA